MIIGPDRTIRADLFSVFLRSIDQGRFNSVGLVYHFLQLGF